MKKSFILCCSILLSFLAQATHNRAGEILYRRIAPFTQPGGTSPMYVYSITVVKYLDYGQAIADRCVDTVYFGDGTKGVAPRVNSAASPTCNCGTHNGVTIGCGSMLVNTPSYKVRYCEYAVTHTYSAPGSYLVRSFDPNRNQGVHNIPQSVNQPFYIESLINIVANMAPNSSPVLTNPPIDQATLALCFVHNPGAVDADGDSLSYEITSCRAQSGQTVAGYFYPETGWNGTYAIDALGTLSWCSPQYLAEYNIALIVREWRKNTTGVYIQIGYVLRDMQVLVKYGVVGLNERDRHAVARIYPNPFSGTLEIQINEDPGQEVESTIFTNDGKMVVTCLSKPEDGKLQLSGLDHLERGIYFLKVKTAQGTVYKKLLKE